MNFCLCDFQGKRQQPRGGLEVSNTNVSSEEVISVLERPNVSRQKFESISRPSSFTMLDCPLVLCFPSVRRSRQRGRLSIEILRMTYSYRLVCQPLTHRLHLSPPLPPPPPSHPNPGTFRSDEALTPMQSTLFSVELVTNGLFSRLTGKCAELESKIEPFKVGRQN